MNPAIFLISFRETLEAAVILAIILAYLVRTGRAEARSHVYLGTALSVLLSLLLGVAVFLIYKGLPQKTLFEAIASFIAVVVLTSVIYWMTKRGRRLKEEIEVKLARTMSSLALIGLSFIVVFREGLETVLFLAPFVGRDPVGVVVSTLAGIAAATGLALTIYQGGMRINLRRFFLYTSILLILIASGLAGYGTHELIEWAEENGVDLGPLAEPAYDLGITEGSPWHHEGVIGSVLAILLGYSTTMEWLRLIVQLGYLIVAFLLLQRAYRHGMATGGKETRYRSATVVA